MKPAKSKAILKMIEDPGKEAIALIFEGGVIQEEKIIASRIVERTESVVIWEYQTRKQLITLGLPRKQSLTGAPTGNHDLGYRWKYFPPGDIVVDTRLRTDMGMTTENYAGSVAKVYPPSSINEAHTETLWISDIRIQESASSNLASIRDRVATVEAAQASNLDAEEIVHRLKTEPSPERLNPALWAKMKDAVMARVRGETENAVAEKYRVTPRCVRQWKQKIESFLGIRLPRGKESLDAQLKAQEEFRRRSARPPKTV